MVQMAVWIATEVVDLKRRIRQQLFCAARLNRYSAELDEVNPAIRLGCIEVNGSDLLRTNNAVVDTQDDEVVLLMTTAAG